MLLILLNIVPVETQCWKEWNLCNCIVWKYVIFISNFCDWMIQSLLPILIFPNCLIYKKTKECEGAHIEKHEWVNTKEAEQCLPVCFHVNVTLSFLSYAVAVIYMEAYPAHLLISLNPPYWQSAVSVFPGQIPKFADIHIALSLPFSVYFHFPIFPS